MKSEKEILKEAHERHKLCEDHWRDMYERHTDILKFIAGEQWTDQAERNFTDSGYAAITSPRLNTFLRQITNEIKRATPSIQIDPKDDANVRTAEVIGDMIRNIELDSGADIAYDKAAWFAAATGLGFIRLTTEFESDESFDQKIKINVVEDPTTIMLDPFHKSITGSDSDYAFVTTCLSHEEYQAKYGNSKLANDINENPKEWTSGKKHWVNKDTVTIVEYYFKDYEDKTLYQVMDINGEVFNTYDVDKKLVESGFLTIIQQRKVQVPKIRWCKLNDVEILEETPVSGCYIPIVAVKGDEYFINGKRKLQGAVEPALDSQVALNYALSLQLQMVQMAPKAPYIGTAQQFKTFEQDWANAAVSNIAFLPYNSDPTAPPPQRDLGGLPIQQVSETVNFHIDSIKSIFGIFDASLGEKGNETSGVAILARKDQSSNSNFHYYDNLAHAMRHLGCIIKEQIPSIYDTPRIIQIVRPDGERKRVPVNAPDAMGKIKHDLTQGEYGVSVQTGSSYGTRRQEAVETWANLMTVYPQAAPLIADIVVHNMDQPGAKDVAKRLKAAVPPQILQATEDSDEQDNPQIIQNLKLQNNQMQQQLQALNAHAAEVEQLLKIAKEENQLLKMDKSTEVQKNQQTYDLKTKELALNEQQTELEVLLELKKLQIDEQKLKLEEAKLALAGVEIAHDMNMDHHDKEIEHIDRKRALESDLGSIDTGGMDKLGGDIDRNGI